LFFLQTGALRTLKRLYNVFTRTEKRLRSSSSKTSFHLTTSYLLSSFRAENQNREEFEEFQQPKFLFMVQHLLSLLSEPHLAFLPEPHSTLRLHLSEKVQSC
jgi:hypothetical protein